MVWIFRDNFIFLQYLNAHSWVLQNLSQQVDLKVIIHQSSLTSPTICRLRNYIQQWQRYKPWRQRSRMADQQFPAGCWREDNQCGDQEWLGGWQLAVPNKQAEIFWSIWRRWWWWKDHKTQAIKWFSRHHQRLCCQVDGKFVDQEGFFCLGLP